MNLELFINHLCQLLQQDPDNLEAVRDLLRVHTGFNEDFGGETFFAKKVSPPNPLFKKTDTETANAVSGESNGLGGIFVSPEKEKELAVKIAACVCTVIQNNRDEKFSADKKRRAKAVRAIINSLSFSELEAATHVMKTLDGGEGLLVAGKIADKLGFARSVVTSALRKLEGANLIETRSLGMKGTYIRIKDALLIEELGKISA